MQNSKITKYGLDIIIENPKGSYKSFEIEDDPVWKEYPLKGVTYPVDYGYIEGYKSEDDHDLDVFVGSGSLLGFIQVWRCDVPIETKFAIDVTETEWDQIVSEFTPVMVEKSILGSMEKFKTTIEHYKK